MDDTPWLDDEERTAWFTLARASTRLLDQLDAELSAAHDLPLPDYEILVSLALAGCDGLRMSELADRALSSRSRLTHRFNRLVGQGLVVRVACETDRRGSFARLTPEGRARLEAAAPCHVAGLRRNLLDHLGRAELAVLIRALGKVRTALGDDLAPVPGMATVREALRSMPPGVGPGPAVGGVGAGVPGA